MGIVDWFKKKSREQSASNILVALRPLVTAVREDVKAGMANAENTAQLAEALKQRLSPSQLEAITKSPEMESWRNRKAEVVKAQKRLYANLTIWSSLSPERSINEVVIPALLSGALVAKSEPSFEPLVVAVYRVCEAAARQKGINLEAHASPEILRIVNEAGDLYK